MRVGPRKATTRSADRSTTDRPASMLWAVLLTRGSNLLRRLPMVKPQWHMPFRNLLQRRDRTRFERVSLHRGARPSGSCFALAGTYSVYESKVRKEFLFWQMREICEKMLMESIIPEFLGSILGKSAECKSQERADPPPPRW